MPKKTDIPTPFGIQVRKNTGRTLTAGLLKTACILVLISPQLIWASRPEYRIDSVVLGVYRDGLVHVTQSLTVNETFPSISLSLLASSIENVIIVDENETVLDYEIERSDITVFTLGAKIVLLEYDTVSLTEKEAGVWTLFLENPYDLTVYLPEESTIIYLNEMPTSIDTEGERILLSLFPGEWEISYVLPIVPAFRVSDLKVSPTEAEVGEGITISARVTNMGEIESTYTVLLKINEVVEDTKTVTLAGGASTTVEFGVVREDAGTYNVEVAGLKSAFTVRGAPPLIPIPVEYIIGVVAVAAIGSGFILMRRREPKAEKILKEHFDLRQEDKEVIRFIAERGGKVLEAEIRERFQEMPRTTLWRLVRRLERMDIVTIKKIGLQNQIELKK